MTAPLKQALDAIVMMDAHDARKVRDMADAHLRDLEQEAHGGNEPEWLTDEATEYAKTTIKNLKRIGQRREGAELQRGLEVAVEQERERLDGEGHVGQTTDF